MKLTYVKCSINLIRWQRMQKASVRFFFRQQRRQTQRQRQREWQRRQQQLLQQSEIRGAQKEKVTYSKRLEWSDRSHLPELGTAETTERERRREGARNQCNGLANWTACHAPHNPKSGAIIVLVVVLLIKIDVLI